MLLQPKTPDEQQQINMLKEAANIVNALQFAGAQAHSVSKLTNLIGMVHNAIVEKLAKKNDAKQPSATIDPSVGTNGSAENQSSNPAVSQ